MPLSRAAHRTFSPGAALIFLPSIVRETSLTFASTLSLVLSFKETICHVTIDLLGPVIIPLEETLYFTSLGIDVYPSECGIGARTRHQADCAGAGTEEFRP
jgi:hypothetical protein